MSLLEKLAERQYSLTFEKVAEDVFLDAVLDELQKLGHESISKEMLKEAGLGSIGSKALGFIKSLVKKPVSPELQIMRAASAARKPAA